MNLLNSMFGATASSFSKKKELEKLKKIFLELKWRAPSEAELAELNKSNKSGESITTVAATTIKEIAGIVDNRIRMFDMDPEKHFVMKKFYKKDKDEHVIGFTETGLKMLAKKGLKPNL